MIAQGRHPCRNKSDAGVQGRSSNRLTSPLAAAYNDQRLAIPFRLFGEEFHGSDQSKKHPEKIAGFTFVATKGRIPFQLALAEAFVIGIQL